MAFAPSSDGDTVRVVLSLRNLRQVLLKFRVEPCLKRRVECDQDVMRRLISVHVLCIPIGISASARAATNPLKKHWNDQALSGSVARSRPRHVDPKWLSTPP